MRALRSILLMLPLLLSCDEPTGSSGPGNPKMLEAVSGNLQAGIVLQMLPQELVVRVADEQGRPVPDVPVIWSRESESGIVEAVSPRSDASGLARARWALGSRAGTQRAQATVEGLPAVRFEATAEPGLAAVVRLEPDSFDLFMPTDSALLQVSVADGHDNLITTTAVTWESSDSTVAEPGAGGRIRARRAGRAVITARVPGVEGSAVVRVRHEPGPATLPSGKLAYVVAGDGIYVLAAGETAPTRILADATGLGGLAWSPNGSQLAFSTGRDGNNEVYVVNADGTGLRNLTNHPASDSDPEWSPDGQKLVFVSTRDATYSQVFTMNADGSSPVKISLFAGHEPDWSPDGRRIAYVVADFNRAIWVADADGTDAAPIISGGALSWYGPRWSPDGSKISAHQDQPATLWTMNPDGTGAIEIATTGRHQANQKSAWSPSGSTLAYEYIHGTLGVYYLGVVTTQAPPADSRVIDGAFDPAWSPDGDWIAVRGSASAGELGEGIFLISPDGLRLSRIVSQSGARSLAWPR